MYATEALVAAELDPRNHINLGTYEIRFPNGSEIWMRTSERPDSLAGEGIRGAVVDEFTLMDEVIWTEYLSQTLLDYGGWALFTGVPKGRNWGWRLWENAKVWEGWKTVRAPTSDNPFLNEGALAQLAMVLGGERSDIYRQEVLAEFLQDAGMVFRGVHELATAVAQDGAVDGHVYVAGVDWGRSGDATVFAVVDVTLGELVYLDRMTQIEYGLQLGRFGVMWEKFRPVMVTVEQNSMGGPLVEELAQTYPVRGFVTTNASKGAAMNSLSLAFEKGELKLLADEQLLGELESYVVKTSKSGLYQYGAPAGMHDDCVMALALAWHCTGLSVVKLPEDLAPVGMRKESLYAA